MERLDYPATGVFGAAFLAGPIFLLASLFAAYYAALPAAVPLDPELLLALPLMIYAMPLGFLLAVLPCLAGAALMTALSPIPMMRAHLAWFTAGCLFPLGTVLLGWTEMGTTAAALSVTGGACALICRRSAA